MTASKRTQMRWLLFIAAVGVAGLLAVVVFSRDEPEPPPPPGESPRTPQAQVKRPLPEPSPLSDDATIADVTDRALPSVVSIVSRLAPRGRPFHPLLRPGPHGRGPMPQGVGSGVIVSEDGIVLTSNHVVQEAREIRVTLSDGRELTAEVVGLDPPSDLAVLRLEGDPGELEPLPFGDSSRLRLGDVVLAIGNPFGVGQTVTMGIVSATGRANVGIVDYEDFIQTDAAINPGNSGGALVDMEGHLVGINTAILSRSGGFQGIGFAIPSNMASTVMDSLLEHGRVVRGWLGVAIQDLDPRLANALGLSVTSGVVVADVVPGSPADEAGLERGDVIRKLDGEAMDSTGELRNQVALKGSGVEVVVEVLRGDDTKRVRAVLGELPEEQARTGRRAAPPSSSLGGLTVAPLSPEARARHDIPDSVRTGVVVTEVDPRSPAAQAGVREGDVIVEVDREAVSSVEEFARRFGHARGQALLRIQRGDAAFFAVVPR